MKAGIETPAKRAQLPLNKNPVFAPVGGARGGISLGYRSASGSWVGKCVFDGKRLEKTIGQADDAGAHGGLDYAAACQAVLAWARRSIAATGSTGDAGTSSSDVCVAEAIEAYLASSKRKAGALRNSEAMLRKNVLSAKLAAVKLAALTARDLDKWRATLPASWKASTTNRLLTDFDRH